MSDVSDVSDMSDVSDVSDVSDMSDVSDVRDIERPRLAHLQDDELATALLRNLEERVARHVLDSRVELVHELEELVDDRLQKLPVRAQEARVLADDVHDVGGDDGLVVLAALHLAQPWQAVNMSDE